jgi:hypothetical protein
MKRLIAVIALVAAPMLVSISVHADEYNTGKSDDYGQFKSFEQGGKDQCLIVAMNCAGSSESVMERADRLKREIDKGTSVYTPEELKRMQDQLNWINSESGTSLGTYY